MSLMLIVSDAVKVMFHTERQNAWQDTQQLGLGST
jgi:hypothetical protein